MTTPTPPTVLPWPPRPPRRVAGIPVGLLICWQTALLLALVAIGRPAGIVIGLGVAAALVVAVTGWRPGGRWAHEWVALWLRYQLRGPRTPAAGQPPELALLDLAAGVEAVDDVPVEDHEVAVISHRRGYTAVLELDPGDPASDLCQLPLLLAPLPEPEAPVISVQLLVRAGAGQPSQGWLAVQARRDPGYTPEELRGALASALRRLRRRLRPEGREAVALNRSGLVRALHMLTWLDLAGPMPAEADQVGTEHWDTWWTGTVPQQSLAVRSWPGSPAPPDRALFEVLLPPESPGTVSVAAARRQLRSAHGALGAGVEVVAVELLVRLSAPDRPALAAAARSLGDRLAAAGVVVERLDGRQLPGLAATLPLGGFLGGYPPAAAAYPAPPRAGGLAARPAAEPAGPPPTALVPAESLAQTSAPPPADPAPVPARSPAPVPAATAAPPPAPARGLAQVPAALTGPSPVRGQAQVPAAPTTPDPARGQAQVPAALTGPSPARGQATVSVPPSFGDSRPAPVGMPTAGMSTAGMPTALPGVQPAAVPVRPDPHHAVRAYGGSLFTAESADRAQMDRLLALARTPQPAPQVVSFIAGRPGLGASTTAAGLARTLATVRDDHTALLDGATLPAADATIAEVRREHAFTIVDLGAHPGEETPRALAASTRVVVVTGAERRDAGAARLVLDRVHQVHPALTSDAVVAVVCRTGKQYRRVLRELSEDLSPQSAQIVPIPHDPAGRPADQLDLTRLRTATREAYLRLAAALALPRPAPAPTDP